MKRFPMFGVFVATLALVGCAALVDVRPTTEVFDELMHKSGLWVQLAQIEPMMQIGASKSVAQMDSMGNVDTNRLRKAIADNFTADALRKSVNDQLQATVSRDDAAVVLQWLSSDLGRRITALEEVAMSNPEEAARMMELGPQVLASLDASRKRRLERLVRATDAAEGTATLIIDTSIGISRGMMMSIPGAAAGSIDDLKASVQAQKDRVVAALEPQIIAEYATMYRQLSDDDLDRYVVFCESPAGHRFAAASLHAIDTAMTEASVRLGQQMAGEIVTHGAPRGSSPSPLVDL